jgi:hypothetical protein
MPGVLEQLLVEINANAQGLREELNKGGNEVKKFRKDTEASVGGIEKRFAAMGTAVKRTIVGLVAALSVREFVQFTRSAIEAGDAIDAAANTAGIGAERLQELRFAFGQLGNVLERETDRSLQSFNRRLGLAVAGGGPAIKTFRDLAISTRDFSGAARPTAAVLEETIQKLAAIESPALRAAQASKVFGEDAGPKLAAALGQGIDALDEMRRVTPGLLSDEQVSKAAALDDAFDRMAVTVGGKLKGAFIDATFAFARFLEIPEAFRTIEEVDAQLGVLEDRLRNLRLIAEAASAVPGIEAEIEALQRRRAVLEQEQAVREQLAASQAGLLQPINVQDFRTTPSTVGRDLFAGLPKLDVLKPIDPSTFDSARRLREEINAITESINYLDDESIEAFRNMEDGWNNFGGAIGTTLRTALANVFLGVEQDWRDLIRRMLVDWAIHQSLLGIGTAVGGPFGAFLSGVTGRASGGPVSRGQPYVVGEQGPELFMPNMSGRVLSAAQSRASAGGPSVVVNQTVRFDVGLESVSDRIALMTPHIARETQVSLLKALNRPRMA